MRAEISNNDIGMPCLTVFDDDGQELGTFPSLREPQLKAIAEGLATIPEMEVKIRKNRRLK